ncbi:hypothetical protein CR513_21236, partial [Mucuna pruriens]
MHNKNQNRNRKHLIDNFGSDMVVNTTTFCSPFKLVYGFNPLSPLDLLPLPYMACMVNLDGFSKAQFVEKSHEKTHVHMEKKGKQYAKHADKEKMGKVFEERDHVWVHFTKESLDLMAHLKIRLVMGLETKVGRTLGESLPNLKGKVIQYSRAGIPKLSQVFEHYLLSNEFIIHSNHKSLKYLKGQYKLNKRHAKWVEFLEQFPFVIKHKQGKANIVVDALSRRQTLLAMLETKLLGFESLKDMHVHDNDFRKAYGSYVVLANGDMYTTSVKDAWCTRWPTQRHHRPMTFWDKLGTKLLFSTTFHPRTDGQTKVVNKMLSQLLRVINETTPYTPFELVYGCNPLPPLDFVPLLILSKANPKGLSKTQSMVRLHERAKTFMERQGKRYAERANSDKEGRFFVEGMDSPNLRTNSIQEGECDTNWGD